MVNREINRKRSKKSSVRTSVAAELSGINIKSASILQLVFDEVKDGIVIVDKETGYIITCNPEFEKQTGRSIKNLTQMAIWELRPNYLQQWAREEFPNICNIDFEGTKEHGLQNSNGEIVPIEFTIRSTMHNNRDLLLCVVRDITERKRQERKIEEYQNHLEHMVNIRTQALTRVNTRLKKEVKKREDAQRKYTRLYRRQIRLLSGLESQLKRRVEFARVLVHELKTPLTPIRASSEMILQHCSEELQYRLARNIMNGVINLDQRIDELLDLERCDMGILDLRRGHMDPLELLRDLAEFMSSEANKKNISLNLDIPHSLPSIEADRDRLKQVLLNIVENALKFTPIGGKITLRARYKVNRLIFQVKDTGPGIPKIKRNKLFKPYERVGTENEKLSGLGLGLALCKTLVELHGGKISVRSGPIYGSTFSIEIPTIFNGSTIRSEIPMISVKC